jgi:hypothetical protein
LKKKLKKLEDDRDFELEKYEVSKMDKTEAWVKKAYAKEIKARKKANKRVVAKPKSIK